MSKPVSTLPLSEVGKDVTKRARALNQALDLPGRVDRRAQRVARSKAVQADYEALVPQPKYTWLDEILKK